MPLSKRTIAKEVWDAEGERVWHGEGVRSPASRDLVRTCAGVVNSGRTSLRKDFPILPISSFASLRLSDARFTIPLANRISSVEDLR